MIAAKYIHVTGVVQGVGFRPFVYGMAARLGLHGWVRNTSAGVEIHIEGRQASLEAFLKGLSSDKPPLAIIDQINASDVQAENFLSFDIRPSMQSEGAFQPISPDVALCPDCERELLDPNDRRYLYPFINCTNCGPRFTIIRDLPYDRAATTMNKFQMCEPCSLEYEDPTDRRFHAQPIACPDCGPSVQMRNSTAIKSTDKAVSNIDLRLSAILKARQLLREGKIIAIKGLGGFHIACDALNEQAVQLLRQRKGRVGKPFALMFASIEAIQKYCEINDAELALLTGREKPIVLLKIKSGTSMPQSIAPGMDTLGVMLPYTPLHHLLLNQTDPVLAKQTTPSVLIMTSGNFSEEPIVISNEDAQEHLAPLADAFLMHNRKINIRCDDSVVRVEGAASQTSTVFLRRSRSYAPYPVSLPFGTKQTLAVGGELKNTFCLTRDHYAFLSQHIGDMENTEVYESFEKNVEHLSRLFRIEPEIIAHDMHPNYFTTKYAGQLTSNAQRIAVQHHHAHIASCMADNELSDRKLIGLSFDGTGYGTDGAIWGGEVLLASYADFERAAHLEYLPLPGGDSATRNPWRIAVGYAEALGLDIASLPFLESLDPQAVEIVRQQVRKNLNAPLTSSMGRLFDAVSSLSGIRNQVTYEAQAAIEMEVLSKNFIGEAQPYPFDIEDGIIRVGELFKHIIHDLRSNQAAGLIGARFHRTVSAMAVDAAKNIRAKTGIRETALSGGVWQNLTLLDLTRTALQRENFIVYTHQQTPANDGGLALGQAVVANFKQQ